ncbi:MAG: hypothetical protein CSB33_03475 [Desulfobacterales bacterium]|nr:MAG: hypothetical protein CSB33_03475 [Desulfobacterales bacterium]
MTEQYDDRVISEQVDNRLDDIFGSEGDSPPSPPAVESRAAAGPSASGASRIDSLFEKNDDDPPEDTVPADVVESSPINHLKSIVLSLEWEITDQIMQKLGEEISRLENTFRSEKLMVAFFQLLGSLGKYIRKKRANAHPDSIQLLHTVYEEMEKALLLPSLSEADKKRMLVTQVNRYKQLKQDIARPAAAPPPGEPVPAPVPRAAPSPASAEPAMPSPTDENLLAVMYQIKETLQSELRALRNEIKLLREHLDA